MRNVARLPHNQRRRHTKEDCGREMTRIKKRWHCPVHGECHFDETEAMSDVEHARLTLPGHPVAWSPCKQYRYTLWRVWNELEKPLRYVQFIGLNPSTADERLDDPTIRRCIGFAKSWGYGGLCMTNLFAFRATDPRQMKAQNNAVGDENDRWLLAVAQRAEIVVACWGSHGSFLNRDRELFDFMDQVSFDLRCIRANAKNVPAHPLYLPGDLTPEPYEANPQ